MPSAPFKAGVQAQQNSEFGGSSDIIHRKDASGNAQISFDLR
jgi:hypothetical protein